MSIVQASAGQFEAVKAVTLSTITEIYPLYYPKGAVDFFILHHGDEYIYKDIESGNVFLSLNKEQHAVGTITIRENEICRLFVLPQYQKQGYGRELLDFAESRISKRYRTSRLDASLPAKSIYFKRGYIVTETHAIQTACNAVLCYDVMQKTLARVAENWEDSAE